MRLCSRVKGVVWGEGGGAWIGGVGIWGCVLMDFFLLCFLCVLSSVLSVCVLSPQSRGPSPPRKVGPCSFEIIWDTSAACPLKETDTGDSGASSAAEPCAITDANYTYSLQALKKSGSSFYTVQTPDKSRTFRVTVKFCQSYDISVTKM